MKKKYFVHIAAFILVVSLGIYYGYTKGYIFRKPKISPPPIDTNAPKFPKAEKKQVVISFENAPVSANIGQEFSFDVRIDTQETEITNLDLYITYDPAVFLLEDISAGTFFKDPLEFKKALGPETGEAMYAIGSFEPASGSAALATLTFNALNASPRQSQISIGEKTVISAVGNIIVDIQEVIPVAISVAD